MTSPHDLDLSPLADAYDLPPADLDAVVRRGRRRATRRRRGLALLTTTAVVAGTATGARLLGGDDPTSLTTVASATRGTVGVSWRTVTPGSGLGFAPSLHAGTPLYALSTAAGQREYPTGRPRVVWTSDDGVEWSSVAADTRDLYLADLSAVDGRVYAVGTGPAGAAVAGGKARPPVLVGWSDDGARTWQHRPLPIDLDAVAARSLSSRLDSLQVVAGPRGVLVAGQLGARLDVRASLPAGVTAPDGWAYSADGVDILGPAKEAICPEGSRRGPVRNQDAETGEVFATACIGPDVLMRSAGRPETRTPQEAQGVVRSLSWAELGVSGDLLRAVRNQTVLFSAPRGSTELSRVESPAVDRLGGPVVLTADGDGFQVVGAPVASRFDDRTGPAVALESGDGRTWTAEDLLSGTSFLPVAAGRLAGVPTVVGHINRDGGSRPTMLRSDGHGGWTPVDLDGLLGPSGGDTMAYLGSAGIGPFGVVAAVDLVPRTTAAPTQAPPPVRQRVLLSRDGTTWTDVDPAELAGQPAARVIRAGVEGSRAVVALSTGSRGGPPGQVVLVGTPD